MPQFLIVRGDDFVHVGVEWTNFQTEPPTAEAGDRPRLKAGSGARVTFTFPPQALGEPLKFGFHTVPVRCAGPSRIVFAVPAGTGMELTAEGILQALLNCGTVVPGGEGAAAPATAIEIPWKIISSVAARASGDTVTTHHVVRPVKSGRGVIGLWQTRLRAGKGDGDDAGMSLVPRRYLPGDIPQYTMPLHAQARAQIVAQGSNAPALLRRMDLTAIGGSASMEGKWPNLAWDQEVVLGRDQKVRVDQGGFLYPFGHRVHVLSLTERAFIPWEVTPNPSPGSLKWTCFNHPEIQRPVVGSCPKCGFPLEPVDDRPWRCPEHWEREYNHPGPCSRCGRSLEQIDPPQPPPPFMASLVQEKTLIVSEPVRGGIAGTPLARDFPFHRIEILAREFKVNADYADPSCFVPMSGTKPVLFPVRLSGKRGDVVVHTPLVFVQSLTQPNAAAAWGPHKKLPLPGVVIDLVRSATPKDGDALELRELTIEGASQGSTVQPKVTQVLAELPALRAIHPVPPAPVALKYASAFLAAGESEEHAFEVVAGAIGVDFTSRPDRSGGLIAPKFLATRLSRMRGPVPAPPGAGISPLDAFNGTTLLGFSLKDLIDAGSFPGAPTIVPIPGNPPGARMEWKDLHLKSYGAFRARGTSSTAFITVETSPLRSETTCKIQQFDLVIPPTGTSIVTLKFDALVFKQEKGRPPELDFQGFRIEFDGALKLLKGLITALQALLGGKTPTIEAGPDGITAIYTVTIPDVASGMFVMRNIDIRIGVNVPFSRKPISVSLGFARRDSPFNLSVAMFGGGGYLAAELGNQDLTSFDASMEFGAAVAVNFIIAKAEVHAFCGVHFLLVNGAVSFDAYIRLGGSVDILGLISVSIEFVVMLAYKEDPVPRLVGRATLVIEVDLTFFSESVTLDSGTWELIGPDDVRTVRRTTIAGIEALRAQERVTGFVTYYEAFAP